MPTTVEIHNFTEPDVKREFDHGELGLVTFAGKTVGRAIFHPGWVWSKHIKPLAGSDQCMIPHELLVIQGKMEVTTADGETFTMKPGDVVAVPPGHDAKIVGHEDFVVIELSEKGTEYAKPQP